MERAECTLADLGLTVSTGKVVEFRCRDYLMSRPKAVSAPMVYSANIVAARVVHPVRGSRKPQWFDVGPESSRLLVPAGSYVVVKRFSAKEEKRRIVAALWSGDQQPAFDNKLNYIHQAGHGLDAGVAAGLVAWLNSRQVDAYFRVFSGHTQVNAGDLRQMRFPSTEQLQLIGALDLEPDEAVERVMGRSEVMAA